MISPWAVGRYGDDAGADAFRRDLLEPELAAARAAGADYMPTIFPGFTWHNLMGVPANQIPRNAGRFFWRQAYNAIAAGNDRLFIAMFDEVDEGTAMFKLAPSAATLPVGAALVPLDIDGESLPSDFYLFLAGEATKMLRGSRPLSATRPNP